MAATMSLVLSVLVLCTFPLMLEGRIAIEPYYMSTHCGKTIQISETSMNSMYLFMKTDYYDVYPACDMAIEAPAGYNLLFTIRSLNFRGACLTSYFEIREGGFIETSSVSNKVCADTREVAYTTGGNAVLRFRSQSTIDEFELVVTAYRDAIDGECYPEEFACNNDRCIDSGLSCNSRDNCGDNSNNYGCWDNRFHFWWVWVLVGVIGFIILVGVIIAVSCCLCCKTRRPGTVLMTTQVYSSQQGPVPYVQQCPPGKQNVITMSQDNTNPEQKVPL